MLQAGKNGKKKGGMFYPMRRESKRGGRKRIEAWSRSSRGVIHLVCGKLNSEEKKKKKLWPSDVVSFRRQG